uniref:Uncharacterized protein n=1 Tax=Romanomermis culicivorax TaxID=13658 RepID=A0A915HTN7_ROMCU
MCERKNKKIKFCFIAVESKDVNEPDVLALKGPLVTIDTNSAAMTQATPFSEATTDKTTPVLSENSN